MVGMQVRAQHQVDVLGRDASGAQALQIRRVELMKSTRPRAVLVIAAAGIEQDGQIAERISHECTLVTKRSCCGL